MEDITSVNILEINVKPKCAQDKPERSDGNEQNTCNITNDALEQEFASILPELTAEEKEALIDCLKSLLSVKSS